MKFMKGQAVVVLQGHVNGANYSGTIIGQCTGKEHKGKWWVDLGFTKLPVEPERIVDVTVYRARELAKHNYPPQS